MKNKNISFAQVLRKKGRSSQPEPHKANVRLVEMVQQWEVYPDQDYTLQLGNVAFSQRSNPSAIHMFSSKNGSKEQEQMFDSWIERQSFITNNKENIGTQPRKINKNIAPVAAVKLTLNSRGRDASKNKGRTMAEMIRQTETGQVEYDEQIEQPNVSTHNFQYNTHTTQTQQKFYQKQTRREGTKSPKNYKPQEEELNLQIQEVIMQQPKEHDKEPPSQHSYNNYNQSNKQKTQTNRPTQQPEDTRKHQLQQILNSTQNIHQQIAELAHKYYRESHPNHTEQDEELLIDESVQKAPLQQLKKQPRFEEDYPAVPTNINQEDQKRRLEEAKNTLNGYLKNFNKSKLNPNNPLNNNSALSPKTNTNSQYRKTESNSIPAYLQVGYSFASNVNDTRKQQAESIELDEKTKPLLPQHQSKEQKLEQSEDLNFRNKYINTDAPVVSEEHIQNIESIGYENEIERNGFAEQAKAGDNIPNLSFEVKLINSNGRKNEPQQQYNYIQQPQSHQEGVQPTPQIYVSIPNSYEYSDNSYRNGLNKDQIYYKEFKDKAVESETLFARKQIYTNYHLNDFRDKLHIKSPKTTVNITSNQKNNQQTNNYEYISRPFEINIEPTKVQNQQPPHITLNTFEKSQSPKIIKQKLGKKIQQEPVSAPFIPKQLQSVCSPPTQPKHEPAYQIQSPSYLSSFNPTAYNPSTFNPANYNTSKYKPSTTTYLPTSTYSTCTPSYSNPPTYQPSKIVFISPKAYERSSDTPSYAKFVSTFQVSKTQYSHPPPPPTKLQAPSSIPYEQKYSIATPYQPKTDKIDKPEKKNFLSQLTIKQSITVEEEKPKKIIPLISKAVKSSINKIESQPPLRQSIRLAPKQSPKLQNSDEFQFQF